MSDIEAAVDDAFYKRWCRMAHRPNESQSDARRWFRAGATLAPATRGEWCHRCGKTTRECDCEDPRLVGYENNPAPPTATGEAGTHGPGKCLPVDGVEFDRAVASREQDERERWIRADERERCAKVCDERAAFWRKQREEAIVRERAGSQRAHYEYRYSDLCDVRADEDDDRAKTIRALAPREASGTEEAREAFYEAARAYAEADARTVSHYAAWRGGDESAYKRKAVELLYAADRARDALFVAYRALPDAREGGRG